MEKTTLTKEQAVEKLEEIKDAYADASEKIYEALQILEEIEDKDYKVSPYIIQELKDDYKSDTLKNQLEEIANGELDEEILAELGIEKEN